MEAVYSDEFVRIMEKSVAAGRPFSVLWEMTYRCNLRCRHCYIVPPAGRSEMDTAEIHDILVQMSEAGVFLLTVSGGEFFLREDALEIIEDATERGLALRIFSNLTMLPQELLDGGHTRFNIMGFETSIYGKDAATHDAFARVSGAFDKTVATIRRLKEAGTNVEIKCSWTRHNFRQFNDILDLVKSLGAEFRGSPHIVPRDDGSTDNLECRMSDHELREFYRASTARAPGAAPAREGGTKSGSVCGAGKVGVAISPCGEVFPCVESRIVAGDLRRQSFEEIWANSDVLRLFRKVVVADFERSDPDAVRSG